MSEKLLLIFVILILLYILFYYYLKIDNKANIIDEKNIFFTTETYPYLKILEENTNIIEKEIPYFNKNKVKITRKQTDWNNEGMDKLFEELKNNDSWIKSWDGNSWYNFPLIYDNRVVGLAEKICPNTIKLLKKIPIKVCGYSLLLPNSKISIHNDGTGPSYKSMAFNLHLKGNNSSLFVNPEFVPENNVNVKNLELNKFIEKKHEKHKAIIFNSEQYHYATNDGNVNRIILFIDFDTDIFYGKVTKGLGLAKKLDFPTININFMNNLNSGIYKCNLFEKNYDGILFVDNYNYGELHILNQNIDLSFIKINDIIILNKLNKINLNSNKGIINHYLSSCNYK